MWTWIPVTWIPISKRASHRFVEKLWLLITGTGILSVYTGKWEHPLRHSARNFSTGNVFHCEIIPYSGTRLRGTTQITYTHSRSLKPQPASSHVGGFTTRCSLTKTRFIFIPLSTGIVEVCWTGVSNTTMESRSMIMCLWWKSMLLCRVFEE